MQGLTRAGHIADVLGCSLALADMELALGRLRDAERTLAGRPRAGRARAPPAGSTVMRGTADMLVGLSRVAWHRNDLAAAADLLRRADELGEAAALPQHPTAGGSGWRGSAPPRATWPTALELLDEAERVYVGDYSPNVHPIHATRARVLVAAGRPRRCPVLGTPAPGRPPTTSSTYLREYEHVTLARLLLAEHAATGATERLQDGLGLLDRLLEAATAGGRNGTVIELEVLRAIAHDGAGETDRAREALAHAVDLAEPDGWVRIFVETGSTLAGLVRELAERRPGSGFASELVAAMTPVADAPPGDPGPAHPPRVGLVDPLSDRELDVLRLLRSDLDGPAIARELVVSLNTVRTHTKHIYAKLGVNNRRAAISKAHQLGLLSAGSR